MAIRLGALHDALLHPGDADLAKTAAEELANYDNRLATIDMRLAVLQAGVGILTLLLVGVLWLTVSMKGDLADLRAQVQAISRQLPAGRP